MAARSSTWGPGEAGPAPIARWRDGCYRPRSGGLQLELSLAVPLITLAHTGDPGAEAEVGAQLMVAVGVGLP